MNKTAEVVGSTKNVPVPRPGVTPYGEDLVLDGRVEYPDAPPMTVETNEDLACVTAS